MTPDATSPAPIPADARRAAARTRDALRAARARSGVVDAPDGVAAELLEPEALVPVAGLARALAAAAERPEARLVPGGGWTGAPFPAAEPYVASWELRLAAGLRAGEPGRTGPAPGGAPAMVRGSRAAGKAEAFSPWLVHSFAGRKGHARPDVAALVPARARRVLDVGCGEGALGAILEARGARVTGIEHDPVAAAVARGRLSAVLACRAEDAADALSERPDVVVLADVLEHLARPAEVLRGLRRLLAPGGLLVFSLPNATHASVLAGAFRGRWDRELEGIVADDHRVYAGRAGWTALLASCGFRVTSISPAAARTPGSERDRGAFLASTRLSPDDLDAVQWLGKAELAAPGTGDVRGSVEDATPLGAEDPVPAVAEAVAAGRASHEVRNPLRGGLLEQLLSGALVAAEEGAAFLSGWTPAGLEERFEASGLRPRAEAASVEPFPETVRAVVTARRASGLPTDEGALGASAWRVTFGPAGR